MWWSLRLNAFSFWIWAPFKFLLHSVGLEGESRFEVYCKVQATPDDMGLIGCKFGFVFLVCLSI